MEGLSRVSVEEIEVNKPLNNTQLLFLYGDPYDIPNNEKDSRKKRLKNATNSPADGALNTKTSEGLKPTAETEVAALKFSLHHAPTKGS